MKITRANEKNFLDYEKELQAMLNIQWYKLEGLSRIFDMGEVNLQLTQNLIKEPSRFLVIERLPMSLSHIFKQNNYFFKRMDILKVGI